MIPAEVSMGLVGLYGLYFLAISWDLSNRKRKKRSLFHQGSQLLFRTKKNLEFNDLSLFTGYLQNQEKNEVFDACQSQFESCMKLQNLTKFR